MFSRHVFCQFLLLQHHPIISRFDFQLLDEFFQQEIHPVVWNMWRPLPLHWNTLSGNFFHPEKLYNINAIFPDSTHLYTICCGKSATLKQPSM